MKYAAYGLMAAFLALGVYGAVPTTAEGWYTPSGGKFKTENAEGIIGCIDYNSGTYVELNVLVDSDGNIKAADGGSLPRPVDLPEIYNVIYGAVRNALKAETIARQNKERIEEIGENLHNLGLADGIDIVGTGPNGKPFSYTMHFTSGKGIRDSLDTGSRPVLTDPAANWNMADEKTLHWRSDNKMEIMGVPSEQNLVLNSDGNGGIKWSKIEDGYHPDNVTLTTNAAGTAHLVGWTGGHKCSTKISSILTEEDGGNRANHYVLTRFGTGSAAVFHYVPFGDRLEISSLSPDETSITTNNASGKASLVGWDAAKTASSQASEQMPFIPYAGDNLQWKSFFDFFNSGVFNVASGKINLRGVEAGADIKVMTVSGGDNGVALTSTSLPSLVQDPLIVSEDKISVSGWGNASPATTPLANVLVSNTGNANDPAQSVSLLARSASGTLQYMPVGALEMPRPDGRSIVTNQWGLTLNGYRAADEGAVAYKTENGLEWKIPEQAANVDGASITTNTEYGAVKLGVASLRGWNDANVDDIPQKGDGRLKWTPPSDMVDNQSLAWQDEQKAFEVKGASVYAGSHAKHYFGTSSDKSATLGWHELPNTTTNRVEGDEYTITSTVGNDPDVKRLGLRNWRYGGGDTLFLVNNGGSLDYMPMPALTNLAACACTQKWETATAWIGGGAAIADNGGLTLPDDSLDEYLYNTLGYIYSTTPGNLYFNNNGNQIQASFTAPENWADSTSLDLTDDKKYQIFGFNNPSPCSADMSEMLSNPDGDNAQTHLILAKNTRYGELHYVKMGDGVTAKTDNRSVATNDYNELEIKGFSDAHQGAIPYTGYKNNNPVIQWLDNFEGKEGIFPVLAPGSIEKGRFGTVRMELIGSDSKLHIKGFASAQEGQSPVKVGTDDIVWTNLSGNAQLDSVSLATNMTGLAEIKGFGTAENNKVPFKNGSGQLEWRTPVLSVSMSDRTVVTSVEWLTGAGDYKNSGTHPYSICIRRGRLTVNSEGVLSIDEDNSLTQYIDTTPHTAEMDNSSSSSSN